MSLDALLKQCKGIEVKNEHKRGRHGNDITNCTFYKVSDIVVPDEVYVEIIGTATSGTIGRLVGIDVQTYEETGRKYGIPNQISTWDVTFLYKVDGRKQIGRINPSHSKVLHGKHTTKYVLNINTKPKEEVKNPVNKYMQELQLGDWVVGVRPGKKLGIGRITRWTNHNVWGTLSDDLTDKSKEFKFDSINETFTMPNDDHVQLLTMAVLKGYTG